ncbi:siderophore-interacting protein [bacterium M00.F.Ca.ET.228.01.1.1]|uniref:siderophore-interacting protein n=1 Tax=Paraburkholderia phenoliruptrix TaxID=252970 RepID=UPI001092CCA2|nr:siderophore-interacting protein [Paraburkholderia phenoliruptrix]TGP48094.1 siderophore-interacting protein [bacterium M00.F.Ca.ET.228.01.1.1]TGS05886.1 siderophore-interacting protein [bacterium M00.F.Ca.ET.191.01.1.1]TGU10823.1 siderophore-interacting protein [bacterium M00.F.Ca.ET.155.01.1.1]MBW0445079.1 siderophore-interacting protein [Paraburkholderia phenoliruptrix]MBW9095844.1 siderophore-interacting protein [Paraburkholderia phenoliruptrix]
MPTQQNRPDLAVQRVRHPLKFRLLQVKNVRTIMPHLVRVTFSGEDLHDFMSASFDDHIKVFFPEPGADKPVLPHAGPDGPVFPEGRRPTARDFTPRRFDPEARELDIEFAMHEAGPAATWAAQAKAGQYLGIGGPRGSLVIPTAFDWHLLIGDDTALPAIARRLEELPAGKRVATVIEVADPSARIEFRTQAELHPVWAYRNNEATRGEALLQAVRATYLPEEGEGYVWAAGEAATMRAIRYHLCTERGVDKSRIRAASYWKQGAAAVHETLDD